MPRQTARRSAPMRSAPMASARPPPQQHHPPAPQQSAVAHAPPAAAAAAPAQQQPSLFKQMAATAGGVAVGSAVGHAVGHAVTSAFTGPHQEGAAAHAPAGQAQAQANPCQFEMDQFLSCAQTQSDITLCEGFNEALKACKKQHSEGAAFY
ncbi:unnamed protein product [Cyprideis torosa]|uniref:Uncharacterized protein n=1 Tax=Cyprideis torosa TaxID=163714 RepID=A0A7R8WL28_9CRUS|nr:unnamed protein product [Cyprideis torosa]CAG0897549.1 unnamed protein product [Cyprideis torosa]